MDLNEYLDENALVKVEEGQLIIARQIQQQLIDFETTRKQIEEKEKELKDKLYEVMKNNNIEKFETNDKRIMITLGKDSTTETIDKDKLFKEYPDAYRSCLKETQRKGTLRITIRKENE